MNKIDSGLSEYVIELPVRTCEPATHRCVVCHSVFYSAHSLHFFNVHKTDESLVF